MRTNTIKTLVAVCAGLTTLPAAAETKWRAEPSLKYDALCLTSILADDPYNTQFYKTERSELVQRLSPETVAAGTRVHTAFKAAGVPTIGWLGLVYSTTNAETIGALIEATEQPSKMRAVLEATEYWKPERWAIFEQVRPDLLTYLRGLQAGRFDRWWADNAAPEVRRVIEPLMPRLAGVDFIPLLERALGRDLPNEITVHATRFCRPFGTRVLGARFQMDVVGKKDPFRSVGAGAIHEMTHPPFDEQDPRITRMIALLEKDPFIFGRWSARPTDSGYNTFSGYINEDVTRALDQIVGERVGVTFIDDADKRWREQEGGFHVAAAVFYRLMKDERFLEGQETVTEFLDRMVAEGRLAPGKLEALAKPRTSAAE